MKITHLSRTDRGEWGDWVKPDIYICIFSQVVLAVLVEVCIVRLFESLYKISSLFEGTLVLVAVV